MLNGHRSIGEKTARKIEAFSGKDAGWLDGDEPVNKFPDFLDKIPLVHVPLLKYSDAPNFRSIIENLDDKMEYITVTKDEFYSSLNFALTIIDDANAVARSAADLTLKPGCRIVVNPGITPRPNELVVAKFGEDIIIGQLKQRARGFSVVPLNDGYAPMDCNTGQEDQVLGTIVDIVHTAIKR